MTFCCSEGCLSSFYTHTSTVHIQKVSPSQLSTSGECKGFWNQPKRKKWAALALFCVPPVWGFDLAAAKGSPALGWHRPGLPALPLRWSSSDACGSCFALPCQQRSTGQILDFPQTCPKPMGWEPGILPTGGCEAFAICVRRWQQKHEIGGNNVAFQNFAVN